MYIVLSTLNHTEIHLLACSIAYDIVYILMVCIIFAIRVSLVILKRAQQDQIFEAMYLNLYWATLIYTTH